MKESIIAYFGGDTKGLRAATEEAKVVVGGFGREAKQVFGDITKGFLAGAAFSGFIKVAKEAINEAQKMAAEYAKSGRELDANTASLARFGDGIDAVKKGAVSAVGFIVSGWTMIGESIGTVINRIRGVSEAQENIMKRIAADTEATLQRVSDARKKFETENSPERIAAAEQKLADVRRKSAMDNASEELKYQLLLQRRIELTEQAGAVANKQTTEYIGLQTKLAEVEGEIEKQRGKVAAAESARNAKQIEEFTAAGEADQKRVDAWTEGAIAKTTAQKTVTEAVKETTVAIETEAAVAAKAHAAFVAQKNAEARIAGIGTSAGAFGEASDETLAEVIRRNRDQSRALGADPRQLLGNSYEKARLDTETMNAQRELDFRNKTRTNADVFGEAGARRMFQGDPLAFENVFRQITSEGGKDTEAVKAQTAVINIEKKLSRIIKD